MCAGVIRGGLAFGGTAIPVTIHVQMTGQQELQRDLDTLQRRYDFLKETMTETAGFDRLRGSFNLLRGIITQASITTFVFAMLMRRQSQTARRLQTVQENTAETIRRYGRHSLEARQALRQLEQAQENARFAQIEFALQTIFTIGSIGTLIFRIGDLITQLGILQAEYATTAVLKAAALGPAGILAVAGGALVGGIVIGKIAFGDGDSDTQFNQQWAEAGRYVQRERRRQRR